MILQRSGEEADPHPLSSYTREINHHIPSRFGSYSRFAYGKVENLLRLYRGKDCIEVFCSYIEEEGKRLYHMFPRELMVPLMLEQWREFSRATCFNDFEEDDYKLRDHCDY